MKAPLGMSRIFSSLLIHGLLICTLSLSPLVSGAQVNNTSFCESGSPPIVDTNTTQQRYFGDLLVQYQISADGKIVICTLYISTVLVGVQALNSTNAVYSFSVKAGLGSADGSLTLKAVTFPQIATLSADFSYSVAANNTRFSFLGDLVGWYINN